MSRTRGKPSKAHPKPKAELIDPGAPGRQSFIDLAIWLGLILSILVVYAQVSHFDFVNYDDQEDVYDNAHVTAGLTLAGIKWAFTAVVSANWMPLTLISHMLDCQLFGLASGMHHLVNVFLHALSALLLYALFQRATGARAPSAFVAFVFALHPLHVGSVAWIAERKDVLSTFFWFLALYAYVRYAEKPGLGRYLLVVAPFCLGLMSKPMLVTFPFTLLLFDIWPLRRLSWPRAQWKILWEKLPLIALAAAASVVTYFAQGHARALVAIPFAMRIKNTLLSYITYIGQMFWPTRLTVFYPFPSSIPAWQAAAACVVLLGVSALALYWWRTRPYFVVGWFWYLGTLVPVIGLVQVGTQSHADRYMYIPMVGLSIILAWGAVEAVNQWAVKWPPIKPALAAAAVVSCLVWMLLARNETAYWQNSETLFTRALAVGEESFLEYNLGHYLMKTPGRAADAIPHFQAALRIKPDDVDTFDNIGFCLMKLGRPAGAIPFYEKVVRFKPDSAAAHSNLGHALVQSGRDAAAIPQFEAALRLQPDNLETTNDLGACLLNSGRAAGAIPYFEAAIRLQPDSPEAHFNLALALSQTPGRAPDAVSQYEAVLRLRPGYAAAEQNLSRLRQKLGP